MLVKASASTDICETEIRYHDIEVGIKNIERMSLSIHVPEITRVTAIRRDINFERREFFTGLGPS